MNTFKISVIIPIYNTEDYLDEAIESITSQSIGFKENIQLILVNDGSTDNSEKICLRYKELYPNNVTYIYQENAGVSAASNTGLEQVKGKYVTTMGSDDKWSKNAFKKGYAFLEKHADEIDVVSFPMVFFEAKTSPHALNYKYDENKVIDINEDYDHIQLSVASTLISREAIGDSKFDTRVGFCEDGKFITPIILEKEKMGIVADEDAAYLYRSRFQGSSALQKSATNRSWYFDTPELVYLYLFQYSKEKFGEVLPYVQYLVMYDLQWRMQDTLMPEDFSDEEACRYRGLIKTLLEGISDDVILEQKSMVSEFKAHALQVKYASTGDAAAGVAGKDSSGAESPQPLQDSLLELLEYPIRLYILEIADGVMHVEGLAPSFSYGAEGMHFLLDGKKAEVQYFDSPTEKRFSLGEPLPQLQCFSADLPLTGVRKISLIVETSNGPLTKELRFGEFARLADGIKSSYYNAENYIVTYQDESLVIEDASKSRVFKRELKYLTKLLFSRRYKSALFRMAYFAFKPFKRKEIWLLSDTANAAGDNGEAMFRYIQKQNNEKISAYFVITKDSADRAKMSAIGKLVNQGSIRHKILYLLSDKIATSSGDPWMYQALGAGTRLQKGILQFDFVFLQHGIINHDLSGWLNKYKKNIKMFVTSAQMEYDSIVNGNYLYGSDVVKLTGLPRHDYLSNADREKQILILPTWRRKYAMPAVEGIRGYNPDFRQTDYYQHFNALLNDERLLAAMKKHGYTGKLYMHPAFAKQADDFEGNDVMSVLSEKCNYSEELGKSALLISDYSSVVFDFAYLKKPVLYYQYDVESFYERQIYDKGYFDYEDHGFGEVCYDHNALVDQIITYIENDCALEEKYKKRVEGFYYKFDKNNCERVYEEIIKL